MHKKKVGPRQEERQVNHWRGGRVWEFRCREIIQFGQGNIRRFPSDGLYFLSDVYNKVSS